MKFGLYISCMLIFVDNLSFVCNGGRPFDVRVREGLPFSVTDSIT